MMFRNFILFIFSFLFVFAGNAQFPGDLTNDPEASRITQTKDLLNRQSVKFIENKGQFADENGKPLPFVLFKTGVPGLDLYITETGLTYIFLSENEKKNDRRDEAIPGSALEPLVMEYERVDMLLEGALIKKENVIAENPSSNWFNYFYAHCPQGITDVKAYEKITIKTIYPGIDWVLYNKGRQGFKYDFIVHPGANPSNIRLVYRSLNTLHLSTAGELELPIKNSSLKENIPYSYLLETQEAIASSFSVISTQRKEGYSETKVIFNISRNDASKTLVIDPQLAWGTFFGGAGIDVVTATDIDLMGNYYITGYTYSSAFPSPSANTGIYVQGTMAGIRDIFIAKFTPSNSLTWSTCYGGSKEEASEDMDIDPAGNIFISGYTTSNNFPLQNSGTYFQGTLTGSYDAFLLKFTSSGARLWATYYGGQNMANSIETAHDIVTDPAGNLFVTGYTTAPDLPVQNAGTYFQGTVNPSGYYLFILKFDNAGNRLWATYYGQGIPSSIATDPGGNIFISATVSNPTFPVQNAGSFFQGTPSGSFDMAILKFSNSGVRLWATFYGGSADDRANDIGCDVNGNVFVVGSTKSTDFPVQPGSVFFQGALNGSMDAAVIKFDNAGNRLWATYFGGSGPNETESAQELDINKCGSLYFTVQETSNQNVPLQPACHGGYQANALNGTESDNLIVSLSGAGALLWSTYFGGGSKDDICPISLDNSGNLFAAFTCNGSNNYPLVNIGGNSWYNFTFNSPSDAFVSKFTVPGPLNFNYISPYCGNSTTLAPVITGSLFPGGIFSSGTGLTVDPSSGEVFTGTSLPGTYTVSYALPPCVCSTPSVITSTLTIGIVPTVSVNNPLVCGNTSAVLNATVTPSSGNSYTWIPGGSTTTSLAINPSASTNFSLLVVTSEGCSTTAVAQVTVIPGVPPLSLSSASMCAGGTTTLDPNATIPLTYLWFPGGQTTSSIVVNPASTTTYSAIVSIGTCSAVISASVKVIEISDPVVGFSYNTPICINTGNPKPDTFKGFSDGGLYSSSEGLAIDSLSGSVDLTTSVPGVYVVKYSVPAMGCRNPGSNTVSIVLETPPLLTLPSKIHLIPGTSTILTVRGSETYTWSPAIWLSCFTCSDPVVSPPEDMQYCVSSASNNCVSKVCVLVEVSCESGQDFSVPNAFTPNGDNINETFCLQGWDACIKQFSVLIFNRWGEKVFESNDPNFCWNGIYNGKLLDPDVFTYSIKALYPNNKKILKKGNITLLH